MAVKERGGGKKGRIVIRNLPYKAEENEIIEYFKPYGDIKDFNILKFEDGRTKGVAFIEYNNSLSALKAIKERNMKKFMGRPIAVDMAVSKQRYNPNLNTSGKTCDKDIKVELNITEDKNSDPAGFIPLISADKIKKEKDIADTDQEKDKKDFIKEEKIDSTEIRTLNDDDDESDTLVEDEDDDGEDDDDDNDDADDDDDDDDDGGGGDGKNVSKSGKKESKNEGKNFSHNSVSKDVLEGRTLFIRNISFQSNEEEIKEVLSRFGELKYVIFVRDSDTGKFRGTAFAQFLESSSCTKCLEGFEDPVYKESFRVGGRTLMLIPAVGRDVIAKRKDLKSSEKEKTDKRNLYLAREGVIRAGTRSAIGASKSDLALRMTREKIKRKMLANFNIYVSPTRLFICNLPLELTDKELRNIFIKHSPKGSVIKECRIMKDLYSFDNNGNPISKGHGFVTFSEHSHALEALRNINNNPEIFTRIKRPVVEFSMENKAALKAKELRVKKSKEGNSKKSSDFQNVELSSTNENEFMGSKYDPKKKGMKAFHSHIGPKIRHRDMKSKGKKKITRNQINNKIRNRDIAQRKKKKMQKNVNKNKKSSGSKKDKSQNKSKNKSQNKSKFKKKRFVQ